MKFLIYLTDKRNRQTYYVIIKGNGVRLTDNADHATLFADREQAIAESNRIERQYAWLQTTDKEIELSEYQMIVGLGRKVWSEVWYSLLAETK